MRGRELHQLTQLANRYLNHQMVQQVQEAWTKRGDESVRIRSTSASIVLSRVAVCPARADARCTT